MWNNIGRRLQTAAKVFCWLGIIGSVILAIVLWGNNSRYQSTILAGFLYLVLGSICSLVSSWAMYGLGLVVEKVEYGPSVPSSGYMSGGIKTEDGGVTMTAGNYWVCPDCKTRNPMSKIECKECGKVR